MSHPTRPLARWLIAWLFAPLFFVAAEAEAVSPPDMPLPECYFVGGQPSQGPCPALSLHVSGRAPGKFTAGGSVLVTTVPALPVCNYWGKYTLVWEPSPCYAEVAAPTVVSCGFIDLQRDSQWRELPCSQALYRSTSGLPTTLFTTRRPGGNTDPSMGTRCGAVPAFTTYIYGGPATQEERLWRTRGPQALECELTFAGPRPNGLYGPTWVKVRVGLNRAETGDQANGYSQGAEFYVPIDGDLRGVADIEVSATGTLTEADWDAGRVFASYRVTLRNIGSADATDVNLGINFPTVMQVQSISNTTCTEPPRYQDLRKFGGTITCLYSRIPEGGTEVVEIVARIGNATDLHSLQLGESMQNFNSQPQGVLAKVRLANDGDSRNDEFVAKVTIPFRGGSYADTLATMEVLAPHFNYTAQQLLMACNYYKEEIFTRLNQIHASHPEVFAQLSYGPITSGGYLIGGLDTSWTRAGHVGVVVYRKGTHYRQTGIIINGTPSPSPLPAVSVVGPNDPGGGFGVTGWTAANGWYLRTPANKYPGTPHQEGDSLKGGFEGLYPDNRGEFVPGGAGFTPPPESSATCPYAPEAVAISTQSPVEIIATDPSGRKIETRNGVLVTNELGTGIHSMAFPHEDGTYAWTLVLPKADYNVQLKGTGTGPYKLTLTTFNAAGEAVEQVTNGHTTPGQMEQFVLDAPDAATPTPTPPTPTPPTPTPPTPSPPVPPPSGDGGGDAQASGGGGTLDWWLAGLLAALLTVNIVSRRRGR